MNINDFNLNLIRLFVAVYEEKNISQAAIKLDVSQSYVSKLLQELRSAIGDALFERKKEMVPTPKAKELYILWGPLINTVKESLNDDSEYDYENAQDRFEIAASEYCGITLYPYLFPYLAMHAPNVRLNDTPVDQHSALGAMFDQLANGKKDFFIHDREPNDIGEDIQSLRLHTDEWVFVARKKDKRDSTVALLDLQDVNIIDPPNSPLIQSCGLNKKHVSQISKVALIPYIVNRSEKSIGVVPKKIANLYAGYLDLDVLTPTFSLPTIKVQLFYSDRLASSVRHRWMLRAIQDCASL